ncbi:MAG: CotH kinase family protein [Bacteroidia bacterium]|nr:CotH kinase family protein [Bacteroidia bacterium]
MNLKNYAGVLSLLIAFFCFISKANSQVIVNEYSCSNVNTIVDNYGETPDWVELYNAGSSAVSLSGYYLSDKISNPTKWPIPVGVSIGANSYLIIWISGNDTLNGINVHAGIKLTQTKPEALVFADASGVIIDSITLNPTQENHSRGRTTDGGAIWGVFTTPSPAASNTAAKLEYAIRPSMDIPAGFYASAQTVSITAPGTGLSIYYTVDGSIPTTGSTIYSAPISISTTTVLRARTFSSDPLVPSSFVESNTYFINTNHTVAVVSVFGDQVDDLLSGSYLDPETGLEYFDESKAQVAETNGLTNKHGNDSWAYDQRGFDYVSKDEMGYNYAINYKVFSNKSRSSFQRIIFKPAANDNYPFETGGAHIRDSYAHTLSQRGNLNLDERTWAPAVLYVNGQYWGVYDVREKVDDSDFTDYYYDQPEEELQYLKTWGGTWSEYGGVQAQTDWDVLKNYIITNNMAVQANYDYVDSVFNVKSFVDYFVFNSWLVTSDWLNYNTAWWRGLNPSGDKKKWRYTLWDLDAIMGHYINYTGVPDPTPNADPCDVETLPDPGGQGHTQMLNSLMANPGFKQFYQARYIDLMNTTLNCSFTLPLYDSMIAVIQPEMQGQCTRWGGTYSTWQANAASFRTDISTRCNAMTQGVMDCYSLTGPYPISVDVVPAGGGNVKINSITPSAYMFQAPYFGGMQTVFRASANTGYVFDHWEIQNHTLLPSTLVDSVSVSFTQQDTVIAVFRLIAQPPLPLTTGALTIPTVFSPNDDGVNDIFKVASQNMATINCKIYDRWGILVNELTKLNEGWNGRTTSGLPCKVGVYFYVLTGMANDGTETNTKGFVQLLR